MNANSMIMLFGMAILAMTVSTAHAEPLSILRCPAALDLTLPKEFRPIERAPEIVETLSANDARRTRYAAAFTSRTLGEDPVGGKPFIAIGSLGPTLNVQGRLKREDFDAMRETARKSKNEIPPGAQEYANRLALTSFEQPFLQDLSEVLTPFVRGGPIIRTAHESSVKQPAQLIVSYRNSNKQKSRLFEEPTRKIDKQ